MKISLFFSILLVSNIVHAIPSQGQKVMIAAESSEAVQAGIQIHKKGGNAIDVAVATALALSVTRTYNAGLGGGGFALIKMGDKIEVLDFRETAPKATSPDYFSKKPDGASEKGGAAVGVPGLPQGLWDLHKKHGKLHWSELFAPAIRLAEDGFEVTGGWHENTNDAKENFTQTGLETFFKKKGEEAYKPGDVFKQPRYARLLKEMRNRGTVSFYKGQVARDIVEAVKATGGDMTLDDLRNYKTRWLQPIKTKFADHDIYLMPPPSSGGVVMAQAFKLIEAMDLKSKTPLSSDELHLWSEILSRSFRGRALLGDPEFHKNPIEKLLSDKNIKELAATISNSKTKEIDPLNETQFLESKQTTHLSVMTASGDGVAMTVTLNGEYGSGVVSKEYGVALNNEMDDFTTIPGQPNMFGLVQGQGNVVQPGKRPLSSMSPTLVMKDGKLRAVVGAPGGPRIISGVAQVVYRILVNNFDMDHAIQSPRVHNQFLPRTTYLDPKITPPDVIENLKKRGHKVEQDWYISRVFGVQKNKDGFLEGAFDSRGDGAANGY